MAKFSKTFVKKLSCSGTIVALINVLLLILGIVALITGSMIRNSFEAIDNYVKIGQIQRTSLLLMVIGALLVIIGLIGIYLRTCKKKDMSYFNYFVKI